MTEYCGNITLDEMLGFMDKDGVRSVISCIEELDAWPRKSLNVKLKSARDVLSYRINDSLRRLAEKLSEGRMTPHQATRYEAILKVLVPYMRRVRWRIRIPQILKEQCAYLEAHDCLVLKQACSAARRSAA